MLADERRALIMDQLQASGIIKVNEIAERFNVTTEPARRDIAVLQEKNLVNKIYGGAILVNPTIKDFSLLHQRISPCR